MSAEVLIFGVKNYFVVLLTCFILYIAGKRIIIGYKFNSVVEDIAFSLGVGFGVAILLTAILGFIGILYPSVIILAFIGIIIAGYPVWKTWPQNVRKYYSGEVKLSTNPVPWIVGGLILIAVISPILKMPLYPPTGYDATSYHLPYAKYFSEWHAIRLTPYLRFPVFTINIEMLYTLMMTIFNDIGAQIMHLMCLLITVTALVAWGRRIGSFRTGIIAGAIVLATPQMFMLASLGYITLGLTMFTVLAIYAFFNWAYEKDVKWLYLSAAFFGLCAGGKYSLLFLVILFGLVTVIFDIRNRKLRYTGIYALMVFATGCPWYIRNAIYTGNPVFPFMGNLFGYPEIWSESDLSEIVKQMILFGGGTSVVSFFTMPYKFVYEFTLFVENEPLSKIWLYALPIGIIVGLFRSKTRWILATILVYYIYWFFSAQQLRYIDPILPLVALTIGFGIDFILEKIPFGKPVFAHWVVTIVITLAILVPGINHAYERGKQKGPVPTTENTRHQWLSAYYPSYPLYKYMNEEIGSSFNVYAVNGNEMKYFCDATLIGDWFGVARYKDFITFGPGKPAEFIPSEELFTKLREELDVDYLVIQAGKIKATIPDDDYFKRHFKPIKVTNRGGKTVAVLFKLVN